MQNFGTPKSEFGRKTIARWHFAFEQRPKEFVA
jgi:hypothetical protein